MDVRWGSQGALANAEVEVVVVKDATAGSGMLLYRGKDSHCSVDLRLPEFAELEEDANRIVGVQPTVRDEDGGQCVYSGFRIPSGALRHPVMAVVGGRHGSGTALTSIEGFDMITRKWSELDALPQKSRGGGCAVVEDVLYAVAGFDGKHVTSVWMAELGKTVLNWIPALSCRTSHRNGATIQHGNSIWVLGGSDSIHGMNGRVEHWGPKWWPPPQRWWRLPPMNCCKGEGLSAVELPDGNIVSLGGSQSRWKAEMFVGDTWQSLPDAPKDIGWNASGVLNGRVIVAGGGLKEKALALDVREKSWTGVGAMKSARGGRPASVVWNEELYVAGGRNGGTDLSSLEVFDPRANAWRLEEATMKQGRRNTSACLACMECVRGGRLQGKEIGVCLAKNR